MRADGVRFTGLARLLRGTVLGFSVLLITIAGHTAGYGGAPDLAPFLVLLPLAIALGTAFVDRRLRAVALAGFVIGAQALMHVILTVGFSHGVHAGGPTLIPGPRMVLGHVIATALVLLVLVYGEDLLHRWLRFFEDLARAWVVPRSPLMEGATTPWFGSAEPMLAWQFAASVQRRGPPASR